ncbi:DUF6226 family protein [Isoptericola sp. F-RaC21]|uniref:DUF6226 family protein n=1 Tax=Isoptericola sp. F-RaC21 TaxID=3141452 RepID=UPI00315C17D8
MTPEGLRARVADAYDRLGLPSWPPPRAEGDEPRDEEYSRVSDLHKYRVVHGRARAWTAVLGVLPGVVVEDLGPTTSERRRYARGVRIVSPVPGTLPLVLLEQDAGHTEHGETTDALQIAVRSPDHRIGYGVPDCGCDACDWGSAGLLDEIDDDILHVVAGPFVLLEGTDWTAAWHPDGGSMEGGARQPWSFEAAMRACRVLADGGDPRLPRSCTALVGRSWLDATP